MNDPILGRWILLLLLTTLSAGCGGGATDARLVGTWENRQGFSKSTRIRLAADGKVTAATQVDGKSSEPATGSWHVVATRGEDRLTIKISLTGKGSRERSVKFLNEDLIEMSGGADEGVRRYTRVSD